MNDSESPRFWRTYSNYEYSGPDLYGSGLFPYCIMSVIPGSADLSGAERGRFSLLEMWPQLSGLNKGEGHFGPHPLVFPTPVTKRPCG